MHLLNLEKHLKTLWQLHFWFVLVALLGHFQYVQIFPFRFLYKYQRKYESNHADASKRVKASVQLHGGHQWRERFQHCKLKYKNRTRTDGATNSTNLHNKFTNIQLT